MTRAAFDTTADVFEGPAAASPGSLRGTFPCRLVLEDAIATIGTDAPDIPYYLTIAGIIPVGFWSGKATYGDISKADVIAVPTGSAPRFRVIYTDAINWLSQTEYYRAYLVGAVTIPIDGCGAGELLGAGEVVGQSDNVTTIDGCGGLWAEGSAGWLWLDPYTVDGPGTAAIGEGSADCRALFPTVLTSRGSCSAGSCAEVLLAAFGSRLVPVIGTAAIAAGCGESEFIPPAPPTIYWEDHFVDTDGTDLVAHSPDVGGGYTTFFGSMQCYGNQATMLSPVSDFSTVVLDPGVTQGTITYKFKVQPTSEESGLRQHYYSIRADLAGNLFHWVASWPASSDTSDPWFIEKYTSGSPSTVGTASGTLSSDTEYDVEIVDYGTGFDVIVNGETVTVTDSDFNTNTNQVMQFLSAGPTNTKPYLDELLFVP